MWQTGDAGRAVSRRRPEWQAEYREALVDVRPADVTGSPFAVREYAVHRDFGGPPALARLRDRLRGRGVRLMLDFVANHTALDHPWVIEHPELYVHGSEDDLAREPQNYLRVDAPSGSRVLAHGRDPYYPGWPDTVQLNYRHSVLRRTMTDVLRGIADHCDGVRCGRRVRRAGSVIRCESRAGRRGDRGKRRSETRRVRRRLAHRRGL